MSTNYFLAACFFVLSLFLSVLCDVIYKILINEFDVINISVFRLFFASITLIPIVFLIKINFNYKNNLFLHVSRSILFFLAILFWVYALKTSSISHATIAGFCIPLLVLISSSIFLKERVIAKVWLSAALMFSSLCLCFELSFSFYQYNGLLCFLISIICFALLDVITKKVAITEEIMPIILKSAVFNIVICIPFFGGLRIIVHSEFLYLFIILGIISNLLFYFLIKSYGLAPLSFLAPLRYMELIIAILWVYIFWGEYPKLALIIGSIIIAAINIYLLKTEI